MLSLFVTNCTFEVRIDTDTFEEHPIKEGVPQGSVFGPTGLSIFFNDIPIPQKSQSHTSVITQHKILANSLTDLYISSDQISDWFIKWKLALNPNKSEAKIFILRKYTNLIQL